MANALRDAGTRQDTFIIRVTVDGQSFGVWDKKTGGTVDSDQVTYYPGGMVPPISLGGRKTVADLQLQRVYDRRDDHDRINTLLNAVSKGKVIVAQRPMDQDHNEYGKSIIWSGILKSCMVPDVDSSGTSEALIQIEVTVQGFPIAQ